MRKCGKNKKDPLRGQSCSWPKLGAGDVRGGRSLLAFDDLERDHIADFELVIRHTDEFLRMEEKILLLSFDGDESEPAIRERFDATGHSVLLSAA